MIERTDPLFSILLLLGMLFATIFQTAAQAPSKSPVKATTNVTIRITDEGATSELPFVPIAMSPGLSGAQFSIKYFGPQSESDISVLLLLHGAKNRYRDVELGMRLIIDKEPLNQNKLRLVREVSKHEGGDLLSFSITTEELA
jgi:hypothetical protein